MGKQAWVATKEEYREEFPSLGCGKSKKQKRDEMLQRRQMADFPKFEENAGKKKPVKYSESLR